MVDWTPGKIEIYPRVTLGDMPITAHRRAVPYTLAPIKHMITYDETGFVLTEVPSEPGDAEEALAWFITGTRVALQERDAAEDLDLSAQIDKLRQRNQDMIRKKLKGE